MAEEGGQHEAYEQNNAHQQIGLYEFAVCHGVLSVDVAPNKCLQLIP